MMMMKSSLSGLLLLLLLLSSTVSGLGSVVSTYYSYHPRHHTWHSAQNYCRSRYTDLATIYTQSDLDRLHMDQYYAWIGLQRSKSSSRWIWSDGRENTISAWAHYQPFYSETCAYVYSINKKFYSTNCGERVFAICHEDKKDDNFNYKFIAESKTQSEARQYCRNRFDDLATLKDSSDLDSAVKQQNFPVWIGLHRDGGMWKWSTGLSEYRHWASDEPRNNGDCVSISSMGKKMETQNCSTRFPFICLKHNLVLVKENKTWEEALDHCRALRSSSQPHLRYELLSVQPGENHSFVMTMVREANTEKVWAGLRFLAGHWLWVNRANMLYSDLTLCPLERQHCGALSKNDTGRMETTDCSEEWNFLCYSIS